MWIRLTTQVLSGLTFVAVIVLAALFVLAYRGIALQTVMIQYGLVWVLIVSAMMIVTVLLRYRAGMMMLHRNQLDEALRYCQPRSTVTLTVGRDEAAINRYVAAEAHHRRGAATAALALLDAEHTAPRSAHLTRLLTLTRAAALIQAGRPDEGRALLDGVEPQIRRSEVRRAFERAQALLKTSQTPQEDGTQEATLGAQVRL
ncbi:MAG: hypothetical protein AAFX99_29125 [Myxococcota bacterium]